MEISCTGTAIIESAATGVQYRIDADLLDWEAAGGHERQMGPETQHQARLEHDQLGLLEWTLWEYPVGAQNMKSTEVSVHRLIQDFEIELLHIPDDPDGPDDEPQVHIYRSDSDEIGISDDELKELSTEEQVPYLTHWFLRMFEDPQNETPYSNDKENSSNYSYIWGGPYDAGDELDDAFAGIATEEAIEAAREFVEGQTGIHEWAPGPYHLDHEAAAQEYQAEQGKNQEVALDVIESRIDTGVGSTINTPLDSELTRELKQSIDLLRLELSTLQLPQQHGGMGHNQPPENLTIDVNLTVRIENSIETVEREIEATAPKVKEIFWATKALKAIWNEMLDWGKTTYQTTKKLATAVIGSTIVTGLSAEALSLMGKLDTVIEFATKWMDFATSFL